MLSLRELLSGLLGVLSVPESELEGGAHPLGRHRSLPGLDLATWRGWTSALPSPQFCARPSLHLCPQCPWLAPAYPELQNEPMWQRTGAHMT